MCLKTEYLLCHLTALLGKRQPIFRIISSEDSQGNVMCTVVRCKFKNTVNFDRHKLQTVVFVNLSPFIRKIVSILSLHRQIARKNQDLCSMHQQLQTRLSAVNAYSLYAWYSVNFSYLYGCIMQASKSVENSTMSCFCSTVTCLKIIWSVREKRNSS